MTDPRDRFISRVVDGRSFADVGGLWNTLNEKASVAHFSGARTLTMIDLAPENSHWWQKFEARRLELGVPHVDAVCGDIISLAASEAPRCFDVVHCSGVLYHIPEQFKLLQALHRTTREWLILTSSITETHISNEAGELRVPEGGALFLPALSESERRILTVHWASVLPGGADGLTRDSPRWALDYYAPWWWLPTTASLEAMCRAAGFTVCEVEHTWQGHAATLLLKVANTD